jgi:hypothetical protein
VRFIANCTAVVTAVAALWAVIDRDYFTANFMAVLAVTTAVLSRRFPPPAR